MFRNGHLYSRCLDACLIATVAMLGAISIPAKADNIKFDDRRDRTNVTKTPTEGTPGETISVEGAFGFVGSSDMGLPLCSGEVCSITIRGENNFQFSEATSQYPITKIDNDHSYVAITEEDGSVSDVLLLDTSHASETDSGATLIFLSDTTGPSSSLSRFMAPGGSPKESGHYQRILTLTWHDPGSSTTDTADILVRSDAPKHKR